MWACIIVALWVRVRQEGVTREFVWPPFRLIWTDECVWLVGAVLFGVAALTLKAFGA